MLHVSSESRTSLISGRIVISLQNLLLQDVPDTTPHQGGYATAYATIMHPARMISYYKLGSAQRPCHIQL
jgi:hypothetical protein